MAEAVARRDPAADAVLFRDAALGAPDEAAVRATLRGPGDVWHAGLSLGMGSSTDDRFRRSGVAFQSRSGTGDRCYFLAALAGRVSGAGGRAGMRGGPDPHFETMAGASLELGHRWIRGGALMRHVAEMIPGAASPLPLPALSLNDETRFLRLRYGRMWTAWACWRRGSAPAGGARRREPFVGRKRPVLWPRRLISTNRSLPIRVQMRLPRPLQS